MDFQLSDDHRMLQDSLRGILARHSGEALMPALQEAGVAVRPGPEALQHAQDKLVMRAAVERLGLPNPAWAPVDDLEAVLAFGDEHGWPMILLSLIHI